MTHAEAMGWAEYINRHGSLNTGKRIELLGAQVLAMMVNRSGGDNGKAVQPADFMAKREPPKPLSLAEAMQVLK